MLHCVTDAHPHLMYHSTQVLIRWAVQRGTSVLPKSVHPERIAANLDVLSWQLPEQDFQALSSLPTQVGHHTR